MGLRERRIGKPRNKLDEQWNARFKELLEYRSEHGDCNVPTGQGKLGTWVGNQRTAYLNDSRGSLAQDRVDRLDSIGFKWSLKGKETPWETRFDELVQYKAKHGDCNVLQSQGQLGSWVHQQRAVYMAGSLLQDRIDRLTSIGFKWSLKGKKTPWETRYNELVRYKARHGDCKVPRSQGQLGEWVDKQRQQYKKGKLSLDRIDRLNNIGFDWTPPKGNTRKRKAPNGTESDDDVDEIGALIYDQVMRQRQPPQLLRHEGFPIKTEEIETDTNLSKPEDVPIKTEEMVKYSCDTDEEDDSTTIDDM